MLIEFWILGPLATFIGLLVFEISRQNCFVKTILRAVVWWVVIVWILSNGLGVFSALHPNVLRTSWTALGVGSLIVGGWRFKQTRQQYRLSLPRLRGWEWAFVAAGAILVGLALITAIYSPPVTVDVLNYHLPRQLMWLQQGSLEHFITVNDRALMMPPLSEVIGLQFLALTGGDRWVNFPQWMAYALMPLVVGKIARGLGMSRGAALLAGWLVLCLPMAFHEASNGKNDLQCAFWIALLAWRAVEARHRREVSMSDALLVGIILALALLTKSTAFIYAPPLILAGWVAWYRQGGRQLSIRRALFSAGACLILVTPFFARNVGWYGTPLGIHRAEDGGSQANEEVTPALVASNAIRNTAGHLAMSWSGWNARLYQGVDALHGWLGIAVDDPRNTLWALGYGIDYDPNSETSAGAPFQLLAIALAGVLALTTRLARSWRWLALMVFVTGLLYCTVVKWQPWGNRLQLPGLMLGVVLVAGVADSLNRKRSSLILGGVGLLGFVAWWPSHETRERPLWTAPTIFDVSRQVGQYRNLPFLRQRDRGLIELLTASKARNVAIISVHDIPYPLMRGLQHASPRLHFYGAPASDGSQPADAYVHLEMLNPLPLHYYPEPGNPYRLVGNGSGDGFYLPHSRVTELGWEHQLPSFAGWSLGLGIQIGVDMPTLEGDPRVVRFLPDGTGWVGFLSNGRVGYLSLVILKADDLTEAIEFSVNGTVISQIPLEPRSGYHRLQLVLPTKQGTNRLGIRRIEDEARELVFTRLVINDVPSVNR